uniref:Apple domain-containing protein n=1 Tax=Schistosoma mansoni TaxID=6183 RepID=A0A5K4FA25_SCHMA
MHPKLHQMIEYSFIITAFISIYLFHCLYTQTHVTNNFTLLSSCRKCSTCNTNMHCNYSQWISIPGRPIQSFLQNYWLETVNAKSDCFILCQYNARCNLYSHKAVKPELCNLYSGWIENATININSTDHHVTKGRVCCCKFKSFLLW